MNALGSIRRLLGSQNAVLALVAVALAGVFLMFWLGIDTAPIGWVSQLAAAGVCVVVIALNLLDPARRKETLASPWQCARLCLLLLVLIAVCAPLLLPGGLFGLGADAIKVIVLLWLAVQIFAPSVRKMTGIR